MRLTLIRNYYIPFLFFGLMAYNFSYINHILTASTRWAFIGLLCVYLIMKKRLFSLDPIFFCLLLLYLSWNALTSFWSSIPILSFVKSVVLIVVTFIMIGITTEWARSKPIKESLNYLSILALCTAAAGILGMKSFTTFLYSGLVHGPNMFASLLLMSIPFLIWKMHLSFSTKKNRKFWFILVFASYCFLFCSMSRASMAGALLILGIYLLTLNLTKKMLIFALGVLIGVIILLYDSSGVIDTFSKFVIKANNTGSANIFASRAIPWRLSMMGAEEGGWIGLGYGVSYGEDDFNISLVGLGYGREKGNSQLAIIEETGKIGLILYIIIISAVIIKLIKLYVNARSKDMKVLIGIVAGIFLGMLVQSEFEAWWTAPGSPEFMYFWGLVGLIRGLEIATSRRQMSYEPFKLEAPNRKGLSSQIYAR